MPATAVAQIMMFDAPVGGPHVGTLDCDSKNVSQQLIGPACKSFVRTAVILFSHCDTQEFSQEILGFSATMRHSEARQTRSILGET